MKRLSNARWEGEPAPPLIDCTALAGIDPRDMKGFVRTMLLLMAGRPVVRSAWGCVYYRADYLMMARQLGIRCGWQIGVSAEREKVAA